MENVKVINKFLVSNYGLGIGNNPKFRLVWSDDLLETRKGLFSELAIVEEIREVPKYSFLKERWILEIHTLSFPEIFGKAIVEKNTIVMKSDGYEPLRVFQNRKLEYLRPDIEICKIICDAWSNLVYRPEGRRLTEKKASAEDAELMKKETAKFFELLTQQDSTVIHQFRDREAILLPGKELN